MLGVYRFKNLVGEIIYIGKSKNISLRQKQHFGKDGHLSDECYSETAYIEIAELENQTEMEMYEIYLINKYTPKYNIRYNHNVQLRLKKVVEHLKYNNISTDSFRKFYAHEAYEKSNHDLEFVRKLLNHSSVATTQRYLESSEKDINEYSSNINLFKDTSEAN